MTMTLTVRALGRTGHNSSVAILGAAAFGRASQEQVDASMELALSAGVNHIDVAPSYGQAETRLAPWMARERRRFFLGCKTLKRARDAAHTELRASLQRLGVESLDLYQLHCVTALDVLDEVTCEGGALEALAAARKDGLTRFVGITSHGPQAPAVLLEALRRSDFDTVLFPVNLVLYSDEGYRRAAGQLLRECRVRGVGVMAIKAIAERPWGDRPRTHATWYKPFTDPAQIQRCVDFALSQDVTGICTAGDVSLLPLVLQAAARFRPMSANDQEALIATAAEYEPLSNWP
jgi:aryl-alcohol dehydrogenase-like predicted oxidoreductase